MSKENKSSSVCLFGENIIKVTAPSERREKEMSSEAGDELHLAVFGGLGVWRLTLVLVEHLPTAALADVVVRGGVDAVVPRAFVARLVRLAVPGRRKRAVVLSVVRAQRRRRVSEFGHARIHRVPVIERGRSIVLPRLVYLLPLLAVLQIVSVPGRLA